MKQIKQFIKQINPKTPIKIIYYTNLASVSNGRI